MPRRSSTHTRPPAAAPAAHIAGALLILASGPLGCSRNADGQSLDTGRDNAPIVAAVLIPAAAPDAPPTDRSSPPETPFARAFTSTRDVLRDMGFIMERVDAQAGVIETRPKGTGGLATPWDTEQTTFEQELQDAGQRHRRVVRADFLPIGTGHGTEVPDLRAFAARGGDVELRVSVPVYRWHNSSWRLNTNSVLDSTYATDIQLAERGMTSYGVAYAQDALLAARIVRKVSERAALPPVEPPGAPPGPPTPEPTAPPTAEPPAPIHPEPAPAPPPPTEPEWRRGEPIRKP